MMPHFEWTWNCLFDAINMCGDLKTYIFSCPPEKGNLVWRQWIESSNSNVKQKGLNDEKR